jgi:hypothetical protein
MNVVCSIPFAIYVPHGRCTVGTSFIFCLYILLPVIKYKILILFICGLFNHAFNTLEHRASNDEDLEMIWKEAIRA